MALLILAKKCENACMCICKTMCACSPLQVRSRAQNVLMAALGTYSFSYRDLIPRILQLLSPQHTGVTQQQFKVLCMQTHRNASLVCHTGAETSSVVLNFVLSRWPHCPALVTALEALLLPFWQVGLDPSYIVASFFLISSYIWKRKCFSIGVIINLIQPFF